MKKTGIIRKVDELGRVVLPVELRQSMGIDSETRLEIRRQGQDIEIRKVESRCAFCDSSSRLMTYRDKKICADCLRLLQQEL